jgi:uncharacterized membrane protein
MRLASFVALAFLSLGVAAYAIAVYGFLPLGAVVHPEMRTTFEAHPTGIYAHIFASVVALGLGPFQFSERLRARRLALHRWSGRLYLGVGVLVGGLAGLFMAVNAFGGMAARLGFAGLALAWLYTGLRAYLAIRARDIVSHRRWMVRNFALTFAAVTLRLWLPASMASGMAFELAYPVIAWLCWVPNLLVAELLFNTRGKEGRRHEIATDRVAETRELRGQDLRSLQRYPRGDAASRRQAQAISPAIGHRADSRHQGDR